MEAVSERFVIGRSSATFVVHCECSLLLIVRISSSKIPFYYQLQSGVSITRHHGAENVSLPPTSHTAPH